MTEVQKQQILEMRRQGRSVADIAAAVGASPNTVKTYCYRHRAEAEESAAPVAKPGYCQNCGKAIIKVEKCKPRKFCCDKCREVWWNKNRNCVHKHMVQYVLCAYCGKEFEKYGNSKQRYCSHGCYINDRFGEVKPK